MTASNLHRPLITVNFIVVDIRHRSTPYGTQEFEPARVTTEVSRLWIGLLNGVGGVKGGVSS